MAKYKNKDIMAPVDLEFSDNIAIEETQENKKEEEVSADSIENIDSKKMRTVILATPTYYIIDVGSTNIIIEGINDKKAGDSVLY